MTTDSISGLPPRPLTDDDLAELERQFEFCNPVYQLRGDGYITISFGISGQVYFIFYNRSDGKWEYVDSASPPGSLSESNPLNQEDIQEQFEELYEEEEVVPAGNLLEPLNGIANNLPQRPLSDEELNDIRERGFVIRALPTARQKNDGKIITILIIYSIKFENQHIAGGFGYDPVEDQWGLISSSNSPANSELNTGELEIESIVSDIGDWLLKKYSQNDISLVTGQLS